MASLRSATQQVPGQLDLQNETLGEGESGEGQPRCDFGRVKVRRDWMVYGAAVEGVRPPPPPAPPPRPPARHHSLGTGTGTRVQYLPVLSRKAHLSPRS